MDRTDANPAAPQTPWLTPNQVVKFEGISRREVYLRMRPGDVHFLVSKTREDGKPGRLINPRSMSPDAQDRWRQDILQNAAKPDAEPSQQSLLPTSEIDRQIAALSLSRSERGVVLRRYKIVDLCLNHRWQAEGFASKGEFIAALAKRNSTSKRSLRRWIWRWKQSENLLDLVADRPGPPPGAGTLLDADMRSHLIGDWRIKKLTLRQCHTSLVHYLDSKQHSVGCRVSWFYPIPLACHGRAVPSLPKCAGRRRAARARRAQGSRGVHRPDLSRRAFSRPRGH
jgi:hypothetical protein